MSTIKRFVFFVELFVLFTIGTSTNVEVTVKGPSAAITGDYEKFTCQMEGDDVTADYRHEWRFTLLTGEVIILNESDTIIGATNYYGRMLEVTSLLRISYPSIMNVICHHSENVEGSWKMEVTDLKTVDEDPCKRAGETKAPVTTIYMASTNALEPAYRKPHFTKAQNLKLNYDDDVTQMILTCYSYSDSAPRWSFGADTASKMKFAAWGRHDTPTCTSQVLHIYQIAGEPGQVTRLKFDCSAPSKSTVYLDLTFPTAAATKSIQIENLNSTENCVESVVDKFYNKELTGVSVGSSFTIILLMVGMAVMKKQLNQQQNANRELQNKNSGENTTPGVSSTEQLNPSNTNNANIP